MYAPYNEPGTRLPQNDRKFWESSFSEKNLTSMFGWIELIEVFLTTGNTNLTIHTSLYII